MSKRWRVLVERHEHNWIEVVAPDEAAARRSAVASADAEWWPERSHTTTSLVEELTPREK